MKNIDKGSSRKWNSLIRGKNQKNDTLHAIINNLADGVIICDWEGRLTFFNPGAERILGIGIQDVSPAEWPSVYGCFYPENKIPYPSESLPLARALRGEEIMNELILIENAARPEGVYISVSASPINGKDGSIQGGVAIFRDLTEMIVTEKELRKNKRRIKAQFKGFPIPTYVWKYQENDFVLIDYNDAAECITRGKIKDYSGSKLSDMYENSPHHKEIHTDLYHCLTQKTTIQRSGCYRFQSTGEIKELIVTYVYLLPDLVMVHTEDVTERKQMEGELQKLSNAVQQTADLVVITNKKGEIEYVNPSFEKNTGYSRKETLGKTPRILKSNQHDRSFYKRLWTTILNGKPFQGTIINKKKNGQLFWCEQTITPMKAENGTITNFVSVIKDITEKRKKQEQEYQLNLARELQQRLYKAKIHVSGYDIVGGTHSAVETGGDFFDFISLPDGSIIIALGDVCGHGIASALIMAETRAFVRAFVKFESDPGVLLSLLNKELAIDLDEYHYVTLILARLDPWRKILHYANAGNVPAYQMSDSGKVGKILNSTGIPLGFIPEYEFGRSESIQLYAGDTVVFLSDGITEAMAPDETEFGFQRVLDLVHMHRKSNAVQIMKHLHKKVHAFSNHQDQQDDITSIICKVNLNEEIVES